MKKYLPIYLLVLLGIICRFLPHPANFTPIAAIALFAGLYLPKKWSLALPVGAMLISDIFIGFYTWQIMLAVYGCFALTTIIGWSIRNTKKAAQIFGGVILGGLIFYLITNLAVWAYFPLYPHNFAGLLQSYYMAIPFYRNQVAGDIIYTVLLVGGYELLLYLQSYFKKQRSVQL